MKRVVYCIFIFTFFCNLIYCEKNDVKAQNEEKKNQEKVTEKEKTPETITIIGVGDIMLGSNYPTKSLLPNQNILKNVENILKDADITVGNLEGTLFDGEASAKSCNNPSVCYVFRMPSEYGIYLKDSGFDYLSLANNHSNDFGDTGIEETIKNLNNLGIKHSGIKNKSEFALLEKDGIKYGFISFAPNSKTVDINDYKYAEKLIKSAKEKVNILIVMFHGGAEGASHEHVTRKNEIFYGENRGNVFEFSRLAIDYGADIVFGQGPHVTRAIELYKNKFISYSAGNFATYGNFNLKGVSGIAPIFKIKVDAQGNFISGEIIPIKQTYSKKNVLIDDNKAVIKKIIFLNKEDFPEGNNLTVTENGNILKTQ